MILWIKALHIVAMVTWFSALFYLPRLFVYHSAASDPISQQRFVIMEHKLYWYIALPSMLVTLILGAWLLSFNLHGYFQQKWLHWKLLLVLLLIGYHHICGAYCRRFARNQNHKTERFYRIFNEIPALLLIGIVILVVVKPF